MHELYRLSNSVWIFHMVHSRFPSFLCTNRPSWVLLFCQRSSPFHRISSRSSWIFYPSSNLFILLAFTPSHHQSHAHLKRPHNLLPGPRQRGWCVASSSKPPYGTCQRYTDRHLDSTRPMAWILGCTWLCSIDCICDTHAHQDAKPLHQCLGCIPEWTSPTTTDAQRANLESVYMTKTTNPTPSEGDCLSEWRPGWLAVDSVDIGG